MARARRKQEQVDAGEGKPIARTMPDVCPVCGISDRAEMPIHLQSHAPVEICQRCDVPQKGWRLDWDGVQYFRKDVSIFLCSGCGRHAPIEASPEH